MAAVLKSAVCSTNPVYEMAAVLKSAVCSTTPFYEMVAVLKSSVCRTIPLCEMEAVLKRNTQDHKKPSQYEAAAAVSKSHIACCEATSPARWLLLSWKVGCLSHKPLCEMVVAVLLACSTNNPLCNVAAVRWLLLSWRTGTTPSMRWLLLSWSNRYNPLYEMVVAALKNCCSAAQTSPLGDGCCCPEEAEQPLYEMVVVVLNQQVQPPLWDGCCP